MAGSLCSKLVKFKADFIIIGHLPLKKSKVIYLFQGK